MEPTGGRRRGDVPEADLLLDGGPDHDAGAWAVLRLAQRAAKASLDAEIFLAGPATGLLDRTVREQLDVGPRSHSRRSWPPAYPSRWRRAEPLPGACPGSDKEETRARPREVGDMVRECDVARSTTPSHTCR